MEINDYDNIADLYDIYVPATFDIDFFVRETAKVHGDVLELMSGTGQVSTPRDQRRALKRIYEYLTPGGTFICTLSNPAPLAKSVDGQLRLFRKYALPDGRGALLLWILERSREDDRQVVEAQQFYEEYDARGVLQTKRLLELAFRLTGRAEFEALAETAGFRVKALYGDYACAPFDPAGSPSMVWLLEKAG